MEALLEQVLRRRAMPCLVVLDCGYRIMDADSRLSALCEFAGCSQEQTDRLPGELEQNVRRHFERAYEAHFVWKYRVVVRASRPSGPQGRCIVIAMEALRTRAPLDEAAVRFLLSRRETEVLQCILCGFNADEIAKRLQISKATVGEYFKHLATKIGAHNRAEMVARVFDWRAD